MGGRRVRAVRVHGFGDLEKAGLENVPDAVPGPGEVLVEIHAAPVNFVDLVTIRGEYQFKPILPYTPGKGPSGIVRGVGRGVAGFELGQRVLAMAEYGGYAEQVLVAQEQVYHLPDSLTFVGAASMSLAFDTAWMALRERARLQTGERVLVLGSTGAVGMAAVSLAHAMGASQVLGAVSSPEKFDRVAAAGAHAMVDLSHPDLRESIREQVLDLTGGQGVDVVIDPLGGDAFDGAVRALAWRGRLVVVGFATGRIPTIKANYPMLKNIEISGLQISDYRKRRPDLVAECYREVFELYVEGKIPLPATKTMPLADWRDAMRAVEERRADARLVLLPRAGGDDVT
jgi:NADPH2:quinone reductase